MFERSGGRFARRRCGLEAAYRSNARRLSKRRVDLTLPAALLLAKMIGQISVQTERDLSLWSF